MQQLRRFIPSLVVLSAGAVACFFIVGCDRQEPESTAEQRDYLSQKKASEVFRRTFWRSISDEDEIMRATQDKSVNADGLAVWTNQMEVLAGDTLWGWLSGNPFELRQESDNTVKVVGSWLPQANWDSVYSDKNSEMVIAMSNDDKRVGVYAISRESKGGVR